MPKHIAAKPEVICADVADKACSAAKTTGTELTKPTKTAIKADVIMDTGI